jgi:hypothetical protein
MFSARSSFTKDDTLLFFASGLDPSQNHTLEIINESEDGSLLMFPAGAFNASVPNSTR